MTANEKAIQLINKFGPYAVQCAIICVEEIMAEIKNANAQNDIQGISDSGTHLTRLQYWESVLSFIFKSIPF